MGFGSLSSPFTAPGAREEGRRAEGLEPRVRTRWGRSIQAGLGCCSRGAQIWGTGPSPQVSWRSVLLTWSEKGQLIWSFSMTGLKEVSGFLTQKILVLRRL